MIFAFPVVHWGRSVFRPLTANEDSLADPKRFISRQSTNFKGNLDLKLIDLVVTGGNKFTKIRFVSNFVGVRII